MANGAVYDENGAVKEIHNAKLRALNELIEAANGKPVLIFYSYRHDLKRILKHIGENKCRILNDNKDIEAWNEGIVPIMLAHPASSGHGINLQAGGNIIIWYGLTWSLELYQQANARLFRQGQKRNVVINHIIAEGTMDETVARVLERKEARQEELLAVVKARWCTGKRRA